MQKIIFSLLAYLLLSSQAQAASVPVSRTITLTDCGEGLGNTFGCYAESDPVLAFADLTSAPRSGWSTAEPNKGAVVSIWGRNFGESKGSSYVTIGGVRLEATTDYKNNWGENFPTPNLQRIRFQLNSTVPTGKQGVTVTVNGKKSNSVVVNVTEDPIRFFDASVTVGQGTGTFSDPWGDPTNFFNVSAGTITYWKGTFDQAYSPNVGTSVLWMNTSNSPAGSQDKNIAIVGWPDESVFFDGTGGSINNCIAGYPSWITVSNLDMNCDVGGVNITAVGTRLVGNKVKALARTTFGSGALTISDDYGHILGNHIYGARSGNRLDHAIYATGCMPNVGGHIAYNHINDSDVSWGPHIVVNHQDNRCGTGEILASHYIYNNFVDCTGYPSRAIGVYDQSWDAGEAIPEATYIYNNITNKCGGDRYLPTAYQNSANVEWFNNLFYDAGYDDDGVGVIMGGVILAIGNDRVVGASVIKNNIFHNQGDGQDAQIRVTTEGTATVEIDNNVYWGDSDYLLAQREGVISSNPLNIDPDVTMDAVNATATQGAAMEGIGVVDATHAAIMKRDFLSIKRSKTAPSVGAIE